MASEVSASPSDLERLLQRAVELHQAGRVGEAEPLYRQVLQLQPRHAETLSMLGVLAAQSGDLRAAREFAKAAVAEHPENAGYRFNLAHVLHMAGDPAAASAYRETLDREPLHVPALVNLGSLLLDSGRAREASDCFAAAMRTDAKSAAAFEGLGMACQRQGRQDEAIAAFERAVALDPKSGAAQANLGGLLLEAGRYDDAVRQTRAALAHMPARADLHTNLGIALCATGQFRAGLGQFGTALDLQPSYARALGLKGLALVELGEADLAEAVFDYDHLLAATTLNAVPHYPDISAFNAALAGEIMDSPTVKAERMNQTVRGGAQTGELFANAGNQAPTILKQVIGQAIESYLGMVAQSGRAYPLPVPPRWRLSASAAILQPGGHVEAALRPSGFLGGLYFVQLPGGPENLGDADRGPVEFGLTPATLGFMAGSRARVIDPQEGMLMLFPAHFWHRIAPAFGGRPRIVIAFDALPEDR